MTQRRVTATNLSTVITALQLGKKTGLLAVERGEGKTFEEGTITFMHGQVVQAAIGSYIGRDAAAKLFSWQACRFSFVPLPPEDSTPTAHLNPSSQTKTRLTHESFHGNQQTNPPAQSDMSRRPLMTVYQTSMEEVLLILERQGFSRVHRHLLLLIDGRRSIKELATLISRTPDETATLLADLQQAGLIQM